MKTRICIYGLLLAALPAVVFAQPQRGNLREEIQLQIKRDGQLGQRVRQYQQKMAMVSNEGDEQQRGLISTAIGLSASYATKALVSIAERREKNRTSEWTAPATRDYFYETPSFLGALDPSGLQFKGFSLSRTVIAPADTARHEVFYIECSMPEEQIGDYITNSRFSLQLDTLAIDLSRIKAKYSRKKRISIQIGIKVQATWIDEQMAVHKESELGEFHINLSQLQYDPKQPIASFSGKNATNLLSGSCFFVPRSYGAFVDAGSYKTCWSKGEFDILVSVKEVTGGKRKGGNFIVEYLQQAIPAAVKDMSANKQIIGVKTVKLISTY